MPISIIIPTRNEAANLRATVERAQQDSVLEIIVVDGNSTDQTRELAKQLGTTVLSAPPGRARQMNAGAALAKGNILLFLHADTLLPADFTRQIATVLARPGIVAGAFGLSIDLPGSAVSLLQKGIHLRSTFLQLPYGDQAIFLNRQKFIEIGGYPDEPILEDVLLLKCLRKSGRIGIADSNVLTSGRRWQKLGVIKTTLINQGIMLGHLLGVPPQRLQNWYRIAQKT
ncbi:MAG: TIGR04283 family arsenosugar biosynthesis glycosyltransferase [Desulfobulbaceae bacterium]|nr:TIGR04283 family arsenosugar biosynthesis glycosyltransferase [Desulfobulbaceae bacterium]